MTIKKTHHPILAISTFLAILLLLLAVNVAAASNSTAIADPTPGLSFAPSATADSYRIIEYTGTSTEIIIPDTYLSLPVTELKEGVFISSVNSSVSSSGNGAIVMPDDAFFGVPERITIYAKRLAIPDSPNTFPANAVIAGHSNSTAQKYAEKYNRTFVVIPTILSAGIELREDITVNYTVDLGTASVQNTFMRFTANDKTLTVHGTPKGSTGLYTFALDKIYPHLMGLDIAAELVVNGAVVDRLNSYSVRQYCLNMLNRIESKTIEGYTDAQYSMLKTLIADLLQYGAAAQTFNNYDTEHLVNQGITGMSSYSAPSESYSDIPFTTSTAKDGTRLISVTMELSNVIRLRYTFAAANVSAVTVKIDGKSYNSSDFIDTKTTDKNGIPVYMLYSEPIYAIQIEDVLDVALYVNDTQVQTLSYGVLNYVYRKQNDQNTALVSLIKSIRNYGRSTISMTEYQSVNSPVALYVTNQDLTYVDALHQALLQKFKAVDRKDTSDNVSTIFNTANYDTVIVVGADTMSAAAATAMEAYLDQSGRVLLLGGPALEKQFELNGEHVALDDYRESVINALTSSDKQTLASVSVANDWQAVKNSGTITKSSGNYGLANGSKQLYFSIDDLSSYALLQRSVSSTLPSANALSFYAKAGDTQTGVFTLEISNGDDYRFRTKVALTNEWKHYTIIPEDFAPYSSNTSNVLDLTKITMVKLSFETSFSKLTQGAHSLYISDITLSYVGNDNAFASQAQHTLNGVAPLYEQYPITNAAEISADPAQVFVSDRNYIIPTGKNSLISRYAGITGSGYGKDTDIRFIPLLTVTDAKGLFSGYAAWMDVYATQTTANGNREGAIVGYFGAATDEFYNEDGIAAVVETAQAMSRNVFIVDGGTSEHTYLPENSSIVTGIKFVTLNNGEQSSVTATVQLYRGNTMLAQYTADNATSSTLANSIQTIQATYNRANGTPDRAVATLSINGQIIDRIEQDIRYWEPKPENERNYIYTEDGYFKKNGEIINFFGINYFPSYQGAAPDSSALNGITSTYDSFFSKGGYNPEVIKNDLKRFKDIGMNAVAIQADLKSIQSSNNLVNFLQICEDMGIYVDISLSSYAYPLRNYSANNVATMIQRLHLHENDNIISYDIAWEERIGSYTGDRDKVDDNRYIGRDHWDNAWVEWVKTQYGSVSTALRAWGYPSGLSTSNLVITDAMLDDTTETYRKAVAAYYRFIDDIVSTSMAENVAHLKSVAPDQLFSFRMSMSGSTLRTSSLKPSTHCFDFQSLASSMAFMQPEGYQLAGTQDSSLQIMFANAYARYTKPDAPVVWKEFGKTVWANREDGNFYPSEAAIAAGARYYEFVLDYCLKSYTSGMFCWWSISGYRANEDSDYGIINPDGSDRGEITALLREYAPKFIGQGERDESRNVYVAVERDDFTGGLFGMFDNVKDDLADAYADGNYVTFINKKQNTSTGAYAYADTLLTEYVAGAVPTTKVGPLRYVNGIVKDVELIKEGTKTYALVTVCNTKQSIWRANTVSLVSASGSSIAIDHTITENVDYLEDVTLKIAINGTGTLALRFEINGVAFGPTYTTTVK